MVSILPSERSPWDVIGKQAGAALQQVLPNAIEKRFERERGLSAIDQLEQQLAASGGDINKMLPALARAYTLNPNLERSGLGQAFLTLGQRGKGASDFPAGGIPSKPGEKTRQETPISVSDLIPARESMVQNPQGVSSFQLPYGPDEIAAIRQKARQSGYLPELEERFVNDALEYNKIAENRRNIEIQNYQQQQKERLDTLANQRDFETYLSQHSPEFVNNPDELELALKASEKYQSEPSFAERNARVKEELRPYQAAKQALKKTLNRPLFGQTKEQRALSRPRARFMVEMGQKPQLQLMIANGGSGEAEEADLLNPLPERLERTLQEGFPKFVDPLSEVKNADPDSKAYNRQFEVARDKRAKQEDRMTEYLSDQIIAGTYNEPGTNLLLVRKNLMDKGLDWNTSAKIIDDAIALGKIKLDPQQKIDYQKLAYPPLTGENYLDTLLNNLMFPITGKQ